MKNYNQMQKEKTKGIFHYKKGYYYKYCYYILYYNNIYEKMTNYLCSNRQEI